MRPIIYLIIVAAAGYLGYNYYLEKRSADVDETETAEVAPSTGAAPAKASQAPEKAVQPFKSKIPIPDGPPGEKHLAKPGIYYVLERVSVEHANGVAAVIPGDEVRLLARKGNGIMKVTSGKFDYELKESQITNDLDLAREAERKYALANPPGPQ